jgi:hypothetical protein
LTLYTIAIHSLWSQRSTVINLEIHWGTR